MLLKCSECGHKNQKSIDISSVKVTLSDKSKIIELTPNVSIEMKYPSYLDIQSSDLNGDDLTVGFGLVASCISAIMTEDERISTSEVSKSEVIEFI